MKNKVFERDDFTCKVCGLKENNKMLQVAHVVPKFQGGTSEPSNLITICARCNVSWNAQKLRKSLADSITRNTRFHESFIESINNIEALSSLLLANEQLGQVLNRMLFANTITAMETYLSDAFINTVLSKDFLIPKLVETTPAFNEKNYKLSDIYTWLDDTRKAVTEYLLDIIYHNIWKVKAMYKCVLDIDFPDDLETIQKAITIRHDIVHRNGKSKKGTSIQVSIDDILANVKEVKALIEHIDEQLNQQR
jgi:hypothetical protein